MNDRIILAMDRFQDRMDTFKSTNDALARNTTYLRDAYMTALRAMEKHPELFPELPYLRQELETFRTVQELSEGQHILREGVHRPVALRIFQRLDRIATRMREKDCPITGEFYSAFDPG